MCAVSQSVCAPVRPSSPECVDAWRVSAPVLAGDSVRSLPVGVRRLGTADGGERERERERESRREGDITGASQSGQSAHR